LTVAAAEAGKPVLFRFSQFPGDPIQALANDVAMAIAARAGIAVKFEIVETSAATPEDRALEAALGAKGSRA